MAGNSEVALKRYETLTEIANRSFADSNGFHIARLLEAVKVRSIGAVIADIDGTLGVLEPGVHTLSAPIEAAEPLIEMAKFFPAGLLTGRPHKIIETGFPGLLDQNFGFAGTEAGAKLTARNGVTVFEKSVPDIDAVKQEIQKEIVDRFPGAMIEDHTMCSIIVGLTKVDQVHHDEAFERLDSIMASVGRMGTPISAVTGRKVGINVHYNLVPDSIDKGLCTQKIYDHFEIKKPLCFALGDDQADGPMFDVVKRHGGITAGVGPKAPKSDIRFDTPDQVLNLLQKMALAL